MKCRVGLALGAILLFFAYYSEGANFVLHINGKKPISRGADRFLSITIDPIQLLNANYQPGKLHRSITLAKALSPAYVRFECPSCDSSKKSHDPGQRNSLLLSNSTFSETQWSNLHEWSKTAGLDAVACIPAEMINDGKQPAVDLISYSDRMGYTSGWQLGYECQSRCEVTGRALGKKVSRLRDALNAFRRYSDSIIIGPDVAECEKEGRPGFLEDYFAKAGHALTAITWHPTRPNSTPKENETVLPVDNLADQKQKLVKILPELAEKLPLWIAGSGPEAREDEEEIGRGRGRGQYLGALFWARRLGIAAKLDVKVLMRQPADLFEPTPEYWVSLLHKMLVGPEVLGTRIETKNNSGVYFYTQCTKPSEKYRRGSVTIFGVNLTPLKETGKLRGIAGTTIHKYILVPGFDSPDILSSTSVKLNRAPLQLTYDEKIPAINPVILRSDKGFNVRLPPYSIGFWVVPDANMKACMRSEKNVQKKTVQAQQASEITNEIKESENFQDLYSLDAAESEKRNVKASSRKVRDLSGIDSGLSRKSGRRNTEREIRRLENYLKRRHSTYKRPRKNPRRGPITSFDQFKDIIESRQNQRPRRSPIKPIIPEHLNARRDLALRSRARLEEEREKRLERRSKEKQREHMPAYLEKSEKDDDFYGFLKQEPADTFPKNDVYLMTGDSTEDNDYDYVKDEDDPKDERQKTNQGHVTEQDDTWIEDGNDFRGYVPNEFFENSKIHNVRVQNVKDFTELWEADCDCKNVKQDDSEDDSNTMKVIKVHPDEIERENPNSNDWSIRKIDYVENSNNQFGAQNFENDGFNQQTQTNKKPQRFSDGVDQVTPGRINTFSNQRDAWRNGRVDGNFRRQKREGEKIEDLDNVKAMIDEGVENSEKCDCNEGNFQKHCNCPTRHKRQAEQENYEQYYYNPETQIYEEENMEEENFPNDQSEPNYFYDEIPPEQNPYVNNRKRDAIPIQTSQLSKLDEERQVKNAESTTRTNLNIEKTEEERQQNLKDSTRPINKTSQTIVPFEEKEGKNAQLTSSTNVSPIFDEIPQIIIYGENKNQPSSGHLDEIEHKVHEITTRPTETAQTNVESEQKSTEKNNTESDIHSTTALYTEKETKKVSETATPKTEWATTSMSANNPNITTEKPQIKINEDERKESPPPVYSKESELEHQTSKPVKKDTIYATALPSLIHEDVVTENTPNLKMKSQFITESKISPEFSELEDKPDEDFIEKTDHPISHSLNTEQEDMMKSTNPPKEVISHIMRHFTGTNVDNSGSQRKPSGKIKRQSKKEAAELFRESESGAEKMASDLQKSATVSERSTTMSLEKMSEVHLDKQHEPSENLESTGKKGLNTVPTADYGHLNSEAPDSENVQVQRTLPPSENVKSSLKIESTSDKSPETKQSNPQLPLTEDSSTAIIPNKTNPSTTPSNKPFEELPSDAHANSNPSVETKSCPKTVQDGTRLAVYVSGCAVKSSPEDEEDAKSYVPTTFPTVESGVLRDEVPKSADIEPTSTVPEIAVNETENSTSRTVTKALPELKQGQNENSVHTNSENSGRNSSMGHSNEGKKISSEKLAGENSDGKEQAGGETEKTMNKELLKKSPENGMRTDDYLVGASPRSMENSVPKTTEKTTSPEIPDAENPLKRDVTNSRENNEKFAENSTRIPSAKNLNENPSSSSGSTSKNGTKSKSEKESSSPESVKSRRSSSRSEALMALKRENEARRARRLAEYIKHQEYQRKRAEQLEELRQRLRQKREKMLEKYKTDLLALEKSFSDAGKSLKRRDAFPYVVKDDLTGFADPGKPIYVPAYDPTDYELEMEDEYQRREANGRIFVPVVEVERPLRTARERILLPNDYSRGYPDAHLVKCASRSIPRSFSDSVKYIDEAEAPLMFAHGKKPRSNIYREDMYDTSNESVDLEDFHGASDRSESRKSARTREISKMNHPNSLGVKYVEKLQPEVPESSSDEEAVSVEYEEYGDEKIKNDEVSGSESGGKSFENRPIVYLFDSEQPEKIPNDVYEQSVRALLNILAQRAVDRDIVQSTEVRNGSKNKRSPRNDRVGDYSPNSPNKLKGRAGPNGEINGRKRRAINNWEISRKFDSLHTNGIGINDNSNEEKNINFPGESGDKRSNLLAKMSITDPWEEVNADFHGNEQRESADKQGRMNEIDPDEDPLFRDHFQRKDELLKEVREPKNVLIKRLRGGAEKNEAGTGPISAIENTLPTREGMASESAKVRNLTGSLDEFDENLRLNGNGTLDGNGSSSVRRGFNSMIININRLFSFLCHIVRIWHG